MILKGESSARGEMLEEERDRDKEIEERKKGVGEVKRDWEIERQNNA